MPTRGGKPPMSARRVELVHGGSGVPRARRASKLTSSGNSSRTQELQQPEEPVGVVFERRRAQEQDVTAQGRDRRDRAPAGLAGVARRAPEPLRFVHDQEVDARLHRLVGQLRALRSSISSAITARRCTSNGLKSGPKSRATSARRCASSSVKTWWYFRHSSPSHWTVSASGATTRQRSTFPACTSRFRMSARLDGLAEADFVGEQPAHGVAGARALRDVELVREEPDASAEERAEAVGFAKAQEAQDVEARHEVLDVVEIAEGETFEEGAFELERPQFVGRRGVPVREPQRPIREARRDRRVLEGGGDSDRPAGTQIDGNQRIGVGGQPQRRRPSAGTRRRALDRRAPSRVRSPARD